MNSKQRHEKEIAARRLEAERLAVKAREKENLDRQQNALRRQKEFREKTQIWNEQVLPRWHELFQGNSSHIGIGWSGFLGAGGSAKVRDLCHKGIPPNIRGKVWPLMIKNDLKIDGEIFEHLNRKVIQIYGVNLTANKPVHPEDQKNHSICPVYRDSFLGLFDEDHPLYPRDGSPAAKILAARGPVVGGPGAAAKAAMFRVNSGLPTNGSRTNNSANAPPPERDRTVSVMKRAQSLSSLATLVTSSQSSASTFTMKLSPMRGRPAGEEEGADEGEGEADDSHHLHAQELHATHTEGRSTPTKATHGSQATHSPHKVRSATPQACIDVTDEPWFQNERNGSLDQSAFEFVQKQLFQGTDMAESRTRSMVSTDGGTLRFSSPMKSTVSGTASSSVLQMEASDPDAPERPSLLRRRSNSTSAYMDSPSLRKHRGKSENDTVETEVPAGSSPNGIGPLRNMAISTIAGNTSNSGRYSPHSPMSGKYCENGTRVEVLLNSARKVNDHFFLSSSSDGEGDSSDDDVIPHIIPQDIQSRSMEGDEVEVEVDGSEGGYTGADSAVNTPSVISSASPERTPLSPTDDASISYASPEKVPQQGHRTVTPPRLNTTASSQGAVGLSLSADEADGDTPFGSPQPRPRPSIDYPHQAGLLLSEDNAHRPPIARESSASHASHASNAGPSSHSKQRPHIFPHTEGSISPLRSAGHSPNHSYSHSYSHNSHSASHSYSQGHHARTTPSRDGRSYSRQSIEEILHNAMVERDTEGTVLTPSNSRFSFQSTSSNARLGSIDGATSLLIDELISVRDDNYFPCAVEPVTNNNNTNSSSNRSASSASGGAAVNTSSGGNGVNNNGNGDRQASDSSRINNSTEEHNQQLLNSMSLIEWDLPRTYPTLGFFHDGGPMHTGLERVLMCYVCYRPDVGYVQGMSYLVATLLLYMDEFEAFKCMANLLGRRLNMDFYCLQKEAIESYVQCFNVFFEMNLPLLYEHFRMEGVTSEMFLMDWMMSLFTKTLPLEVAAHIWDVYLYEGEMYLMCVALGILKMYAPRLSMCTVEKVSPFLLHLPEDIKPEELFHCISQIKISRKKYDRIRLKMAIKCYGSLEAYQKSQEPIPPVVLDPITLPTATTSPNSNNVHYISSAPGKSPNTTSPNNNTGNSSAAPDFWERRRMFRRSIFENWTLRRWLPSPTVTNGTAAGAAGAKSATRRASTTYGGTTPNTSANNSASKNRRASTTAVNK